MDGARIRKYWSGEIDALLSTYRQFETLVPDGKGVGAAHHGEDGRYVEALLTGYLQRFLPKGLEILTGFILRPAVKTGLNGRGRRRDSDQHSGQLDLIVYDSSSYPVFQRFGSNVIVPPEGVVAIISVKKHLRDGDIAAECSALLDAAKLCHCLTSHGDKQRGPYLAIISMKSLIEKKKIETRDWIFEQIKNTYSSDPLPTFDDLVGYIGALSS